MEQHFGRRRRRRHRRVQLFARSAFAVRSSSLSSSMHLVVAVRSAL